ncbi:flagellar basal body P-ring formation chaperone FlgA [Balneolaceae bacterium ANBcel3]|nr:flagellar basal body P-ring formation chaperone FlgA [Balneolaceae bacterium ANBcel3]
MKTFSRLLALVVFSVSAVIVGISDAAGSASAETAREAILKKAVQSIEAQYHPEKYRFDVSARWIPASLDRLSGDVVREVRLEDQVERYTNFVVVYDLNGSRRQVDVQLQIHMEINVPVARERIVSGTLIEKEHLRKQWVEVPRDRGQLAESKNQVTGKVIRRTLSPGEPVRIADLTEEYLIEAGESITLSFIGNGMRVDIVAVSRQDGSLNDEIRVYSNETRRTYLAVVHEPGRVLWKRTL